MRTRLSAGLFDYQMDWMLRAASMSRGTSFWQVGQYFSRPTGSRSCPHSLWVMVLLNPS